MSNWYETAADANKAEAVFYKRESEKQRARVAELEALLKEWDAAMSWRVNPNERGFHSIEHYILSRLNDRTRAVLEKR